MTAANLFKDRLLTRAAIVGLVYSILASILILTSDTIVLGINAFIKPLKFGLSTVILMLTFSWYSNFVPRIKRRSFRVFAWINIAVLTFELSWILIQSFRGTLSHFNISSAFEGMMFSLMGITIAISTSWTIVLFRWTFRSDFRMNRGILWALRFGIIYFIVFGFTGFIMGANLAHTVGAPDGGAGLPFLNWSTRAGDLRVPHFMGMHALQILPLLARGLNLKALGAVILSVVYGLFCVAMLYLALQAIPVIQWT